MQQMIFIADLIACSTCFGQYYVQSSGAREYYTGGCCLWYLVFKLSVCCGAEGCVFGLRAADDGHNGARNMLSKQ
jgi:hypothetical protein